MKKNSIVIFCILSFLSILNAKEFSNSEIQNIVEDFYYRNNRSLHIWKEGRSSVLLEANKESDFYEWKNLVDQDETTAWVEGAAGDGIGEYFLSTISNINEYGISTSFNYRRKRKINIHLNLINGYCKNESLFKKNNRVKKAKITIYDIPLNAGVDTMFVDGEPIIILNDIIELDDSMDSQEFIFETRLANTNSYCTPVVLLKFEILDIYKGSDYDDTAISEIEVFGEYLNTQD